MIKEDQITTSVDKLRFLGFWGLESRDYVSIKMVNLRSKFIVNFSQSCVGNGAGELLLYKRKQPSYRVMSSSVTLHFGR